MTSGDPWRRARTKVWAVGVRPRRDSEVELRPLAARCTPLSTIVRERRASRTAYGDHFAVPVGPPQRVGTPPVADRSLERSIIPLSTSAAAIQRVIESSVSDRAKAWGWCVVSPYCPGSYLNETRSFVRYVIPPSSPRWMSCSTTSATRRSRIVALAALMAVDAASSQD